MSIRLFILCLLALSAVAADLALTDQDLPRVPATEPGRAAATLQVREGFRVELVASEPLVVDPVALAFDENGRMFVAEMRDYSERRDEKLGRIKRLEDTDGDGIFDKATVYAQNLAWPTAVICYDGGLFVGASPDILYLKDTDGDGVAEVRRVAFTGFGNAMAKLNVQQLLNSFTWGIDHRLHGALGGNAGVVTNLMRAGAKPLELRGRDFSFDPRTFEMRAESGGGQWGLSFDDEGNKFICNNSRHIAVEMYDGPLRRNPFYSLPPPDVSIAADGDAAEVFRISPDEPWRVLRTKWRVAGLVPGPVEGGGRASGYFTGAAGVTIYRGDAFPPEYRGNAFIADCGSNLIHRKRIRRDGLNFIAERAPDEPRREFLASRDNWFRPVAMANAPDGTIYVLDMYRETVEHPWSLPPELKSRLDLNSGNDRGRIYRVVPEGFKQPKPVRLGAAGPMELVKTLAHSNGWHRDTAARLLWERQDTNAIPLLRKLLRESPSNLARAHALLALRGFDALTPDDWKHALVDGDAVVRAHAVRSVDTRTGKAALRALANDADVRVRYAVALAANDSVTLTKLIQRDVEEPWMRAAVLNGLSAGAADVFAALVGDPQFNARSGAVEFLGEAARSAGAGDRWPRLALGLRVSAASSNALTFAAAVSTGLGRRGMSLAAVDAKLFGQFSQKARAQAVDVAQSDARRVEAVEFLAFSPDAESDAVLLRLLGPTTSASLQSAAVMVLSQQRANAVTNVLAHWTQLAPPTRTKAVALLLARRESAGALVRAVEQGTVGRAEIPAAEVQRLTSHTDGDVRREARRVFQRDESARSEVVQKFRPALDLAGDVGRGQMVYQQRCASCHRSGGEGFAVGPDLASVATAGKEKLLASLLDPNAEVAAAYMAYAIETKGGESFLGLLAEETPQAVMLKLPNGETMRLGRETISALRAGDKSLMPEGLEEGLSAQDVADLLEFVVRAKPAGAVNQ